MLGPEDDADANANADPNGDPKPKPTSPARQPRALSWRRLVFLGPPRPTPTSLSAPPPPPLNAAGGRPANAPALPPKASQKITLRASIAELLLVSKLRARSLLGRGHPNLADAEATRDAERDAERKVVLERYAHILAVTCKSWFPPETTASPPATHQRRL